MQDNTKRILVGAAIAVALGLTLTTCVQAQTTAGSTATGQSAADAGAMAQTGDITFEAAEQRRHSSVSTTPSVYVPPSMFGGANNCGQSNTAGVGVTGFTIGGSVASESDACNAREDTAVSYKLGHRDVAEMRFYCFGLDANRMAWEATGRKCPDTATAKGIETRTTATRANRDAFGFPTVAGG